jgi:hypothetical protein
MRLHYRGFDYESSHSAIVTPGSLTGKYRGASWRSRKPSDVSISHDVPPLKYRGVSYQPRTNEFLL